MEDTQPLFENQESHLTTLFEIPGIVVRGMTTAMAGFLGSAIFSMHMQINTYARVTHYTFAVALSLSAILRLLCVWFPVAVSFTFAGLAFISAQRGYASIHIDAYPRLREG